MQTTTLSFGNMHNHGALFTNLLRARRQSFIVQNKWALPEADGMEYDQYDTPASRWVAVHDDLGRVLAGIRLTPTTARCGIYTYMIRDAQRGLLDSIPDNLLYKEAPVAPHIWETSRVFVAHDVPASVRRRVHSDLVTGMCRAAREVGATQLLGLIPAIWARFARIHGLEAEAAGSVMEIDGIENQCVMFDMGGSLH